MSALRTLPQALSDAAASTLAVELEPLEAELHERLAVSLRDRFADAYASGERLNLDVAVAHGLALSALVSAQ